MSKPLLVRADLAQIEARMIAWLAGAEKTLAAFRAYDAGTGPDLYRVTAADLLGKRVEDVTKEERQGQGKVPMLALGFQGGPDALQNMARAYNVHVPKHPRTAAGIPDYSVDPEVGTDLWMVRRWRANNPELSDKETGLWAQLERAAFECVSNPPGREFWVNGKIRFKRSASAMTMLLPSGRPLWYWNPKLRVRTTPYGKEKMVVTYRAEDAQTHMWGEWVLYGGLAAENATQAAARDVIRDGWSRCEATGVLKPVMSVHDEMICECHDLDAPEAVELITKCLTAPVGWAPGLPLACEASAGPRYVKG